MFKHTHTVTVICNNTSEMLSIFSGDKMRSVKSSTRTSCILRTGITVYLYVHKMLVINGDGELGTHGRTRRGEMIFEGSLHPRAKYHLNDKNLHINDSRGV